jgi:hypothetical protein
MPAFRALVARSASKGVSLPSDVRFTQQILEPGDVVLVQGAAQANAASGDRAESAHLTVMGEDARRPLRISVGTFAEVHRTVMLGLVFAMIVGLASLVLIVLGALVVP